MGDWAAGYLTTTKKLKAGTDFGWSASPSTNGTFIMLADSFGLPKGAKDPAEVNNWLKLLGSKEGQDAFNPLKGSIAARLEPERPAEAWRRGSLAERHQQLLRPLRNFILRSRGL